jgi:hypothetical protein
MKKQQLVVNMAALLGELSGQNSIVIAASNVAFCDSLDMDDLYKYAKHMCECICVDMIHKGVDISTAFSCKQAADLIANASASLALLLCEVGRRSPEHQIYENLVNTDHLIKRIFIEQLHRQPHEPRSYYAKAYACQAYYIALLKTLDAYKGDRYQSSITHRISLALVGIFDGDGFMPSYAHAIPDPTAGSMTSLLGDLLKDQQSFLALANALHSIKAKWEKRPPQEHISQLEVQIVESLSRAIINNVRPDASTWLRLATSVVAGSTKP